VQVLNDECILSSGERPGGGSLALYGSINDEDDSH
jgi:hypothetical protein